MDREPEELEAPQPPRGHVRIVYLGPVAPHWDVQSDFGDRMLIEEFRQRALARLVLLPPPTMAMGPGWAASPAYICMTPATASEVDAPSLLRASSTFIAAPPRGR